MSEGLRVARRFTHPSGAQDVFSTVEWETRTTRITDPDGRVIFEGTGEVPAQWSQVAADILVSKYFRRAGVDAEGGGETSARQVVRRLTGCWRDWGERSGYFASPEDAQAFQDELDYMLLHQMAAPNSPQWFNTGLAHAYGISGPAQGHWYVDPDTAEPVEAADAYTRPQPHACFPAGTHVMMRAGSVPIEKVAPGDEVMTHRGRLRKVLGVMQRQVHEPLVRVDVSKLAHPVVATSNHPVLAMGAADARRVRRGEDVAPAWIHAGDLRRGDFVVVAGPEVKGTVPGPADLATGLGRFFDVTADTITTCNASHRPTMRRHVRFDDPGVFRLFGRWLGDGSLGHESRDGELSSVNFVFDAEDRAGMDDVARLMQAAFGVATQPEFAEGQRTAHLRFIRRPLARWFAETFGEGFAGKRVPAFVLEAPREHRLQTLVGLFQSDGCVQRGAGFVGINFDHSNRALAEAVWRIARSLGYAANITGGTVRPGGTAPHYRVRVSAKDAADLAVACGVEAWGRALRTELRLDGYVAYRVESVDSEAFYGTVYNLQVEEDESYVAENVVVHNCFILGVSDDLVNPGGIMDLWTREARIFKYGSGSGSNFSRIRGTGEPLSGGGTSSGLMSFLKVGDRAAGAIKSGGTTRRAAKMVVLDLDHPDIEAFVSWKAEEERKVAALVAGGYSGDFEGEAYNTVSGQNANNSVRVPDAFFEALDRDGEWELVGRVDGQVVKRVRAIDLWERISRASWESADPGLQYDTTINNWHTCPEDGRINASNPCSEYLFLDDSACNLASLNLVSFQRPDGGFDVDGYRHAIRLWTIVLEISVLMAAFPSREIARNSHDFRTLGLGYANLGSLLMRQGIAYDSDAGRAICGALTSILTGDAYAASAELAAQLGPFARFEANREHMLRVIRNHRRVAYDAPAADYEGLSVTPTGVDEAVCPPDLLAAARSAWDRAQALGEAHGYRNAQVSCLAPTGTIGLLMDCDTTGVEPDFALVKFKKLAGGGYFKIVNAGVAPALRHLGYDAAAVDRIITYVVGTAKLDHPVVNRAALATKGLAPAELDAVEAALPGAFDLGGALAPWVLGPETLARLGLDPEDPALDVPAALGFSAEDVRAAGLHICGHQTVEGAPGLDPGHLPVFDCANRCGDGERFIAVDGHVEMMAAAQPSLSGAISKTVNVPHEVGVEEIGRAYRLGWERGLKAVAIYRDGSKLAQPLNSGAETDDAGAEDVEAQETITDAIKATMAWNPFRRPMPSRRRGNIFELRVGDQKMYLHTGEYDDGTLGEMFIDVSKEGATLRSLVNCFAIAVSKGLQYGVPLEEFVDTFVFTQFEPRGMVMGHPNVKMSTSLVDAVFRVLGVEYLARYDLAHVPPEDPGIGPVDDSGPVVEATATVVDAPALPLPAPPPAPPAPAPAAAGTQTVHVHTDALSAQASSLMGDAPLCSTCGHITVRNGSCYRCLNCGTSMGCS